METYAIISMTGYDRGIVEEVVQDTRDAGDPQFCAEMTARTRPGQRWVWVDGDATPGQVLTVDEDGCAEGGDVLPSRIVIIDREPDDPTLSANGGDYRLTRHLIRLPDGRYQMEHHSSWDGDYCPDCGSYDRPGHDGCPGPDILTEEKARALLG